MAVNQNSFIIAVTGGKGGVGKSVLSANLAMAFLMEMRAPTLLVDADSLSCGDQNVILGVREPKTLGDLVSFQNNITNTNLNSVVSSHPGSNLGFIAAVKGRDEQLSSSPELVVKQLEALSHFYRFIVVDLGSNLNDLQLAILEKSTAIILVTTPEVLAVNQSVRLVNELYAQSVPSDVIQVVVNRASSTGLAPAAIGQTMRRPILGIIPQDDVSAGGSLQRSAPFVLTSPKAPVSSSYFEIVRRLTGGLLQQLKSSARPQGMLKKSSPSSGDAVTGVASGSSGTDPRIALKITVHNELIKAMDLKKNITDTQGDPQREAELKKKTHVVVSQLVDKISPGLSRDERATIIVEVLNEALGLGPLEDLLSDPAVTEIMVCGFQKIYIEKNGLVQLSPITFTSNFHLRKVIERIVAPLGRQINESVPYVDARLKDGSRVNAVIEPLAIDGPAVTIRKFRKKPVSPETYVNEWHAATANMMEFLRICVQNKLNVIISGGTGSGKTTLLNTLSGFIPSNERLVTIEDAAELQLKQDHIVRLETRPANPEGTGAVTIRDLVRNSLRMRPDRIVVGECRDGAALDMLQAMSTGHDGSMTTVHANNPKEAIGRLETLCMMAGMDLPAKAIREQIAGSVNLIVQIQRLSDGTRKLISVSEVQGLQGEVVVQQEVFRFVEKGFDKNRKIVGMFQATGLIPKFIEKFEKRGLIVPKTLFSNDPAPPASLGRDGTPPRAQASGGPSSPTKSGAPVPPSSSTAGRPGPGGTSTASHLKKVPGGGRR